MSQCRERISPDSVHMKKMIDVNELGILADDLTGACDTAAVFASRNVPVKVVMDTNEYKDAAKIITVINTQSRISDPDESRDKARRAGVVLKNKKVILKKIDSSLRGRVPEEINGLLETSGSRRTVLLPAIPSIGKTVKNRKIYDNGIPIHKKEYAEDPLNPIISSSIRDILSEELSSRVEIWDAEEQRDIETAVNLTLQDEPVLYIGSLGIAEALSGRVLCASHKKVLIKKCGKCLIVSGSAYSKTMEQMKRAESGFRIKKQTVSLDMSGNNPISPEYSGPLLLINLEVGLMNKKNPLEIREQAGKILLEIINIYQPDGIGIIGGETAYAVLMECKVKELRVKGRISEVMPYGIIKGGILTDSVFVTKGGSVGEENSIIQMIDFLRNGAAA